MYTPSTASTPPSMVKREREVRGPGAFARRHDTTEQGATGQDTEGREAGIEREAWPGGGGVATRATRLHGVRWGDVHLGGWPTCRRK